MDHSSVKLYQDGAIAFKRGRYPNAIANLEQFCKETTNRKSKQFFQAQMWLAQAYYRDDRDLHAIALCEQLAKSEIPQVRQWATNALDNLMSTTETTPQSSSARSSAKPPSPLTVTESQPSTQAASPKVATPPPPLPADNNPFDEGTPIASGTAQNTELPVDQPSTTSDSRFVYDSAVIPKSSARPSTEANPVRRQRRTTPKKPQQKDLTPQVMSAIAHGSVSMLASISLYILFSDSFMANGLGLLRFAVPLSIFLTTQDKVVKENAREALNYTITCLILVIPFIFAVVALALVFALMLPIGLVLGLALASYLILLSFYPVVATFVCLTNENRVFAYPNWLILHLL